MASGSAENSRGRSAIRKFLQRLAVFLFTLLLAGLLGATLVRFAPGFGLSTEQLDTRLTAESVQALRDAHAGERNLPLFYARFLGGLFTGNLGISLSFKRPITELLRERDPVTLSAIGWGMILGWFIGFSFA